MWEVLLKLNPDVSVNYCTNVSYLGNPKALRDKLVHSKLKLTDDAERGNFPCGRGNCEICNILTPGKEFKSTGELIQFVRMIIFCGKNYTI